MRMHQGFGIAVWAALCMLMPPVSAQARTPRAHNASATFAARDTSYLGIGVVDISPGRAQALKLKNDYGAEVTSVAPDGPAAKAGMQVGDVVLEFNGQPVQGMEHLQRLVRETPAGRQVKLCIWRNHAGQTLTATVGARKEMVAEPPEGPWPFPGIPMPKMPPMDIPTFVTITPSAMLGIQGEALGPEAQLAEFFGVKEGVLVKEVFRNSPAEKAGIRAGDVIVRVGDTRVATTREITGALCAGGHGKRTYTITVMRNRKEVPVAVTLEPHNGYLMGRELPLLGRWPVLLDSFE